MRFLLFVLLLPQFAQGQLLDSISLFLQEKPRIVAKLDVRGSFVSNSSARFIGAKVGLQHARRFQYGIGYSFLLSPVKQEIEVDGTVYDARLRMGYLTPYVDYAFYQRGPWEARIPVQIGLGTGSLVYEDGEGGTQRYRRTGLILYEPAMTLQYRFLKYFAVAGGWGFRLVLQTREDLGERLTAPIYILGFRILFEDLWRDMESKGE